MINISQITSALCVNKLEEKDMKKLIFVILVFTVLLGACQNRSSTGQTSGASEGLSGTLVFWFGNIPVAEALMEAFNVIHPNVTFEFERVGSQSRPMATLAGPAGTGPDVFSIPHDQSSMAIEDGILEPIPPSTHARLRGLIHESAMETITRDGILYGIPYQTENIAFFYNKDIVSNPPSSFEEIIEFSRTWNDPANGRFALRWPVNNPYFNYMFFTPFGFSVFGSTMDDYRNPGFDSSAMAQGLAFHSSLRQVQNMPAADTSGGTPGTNAFMSGDAPFLISGPWDIINIRNSGLNFGITRFPTINGVQPVCFSGVQLAVVSSYSKNFEAAFAFAEFLASEEAAYIYYSVGNFITALADISRIPGLADDVYVQGILEQTPYTVPMPIIPEMSPFFTVMDETLMFAWDGQLTIPEAQARAMDSFEVLINVTGRSIFD